MPRFDPHVFLTNITPRWWRRLTRWRSRRRPDIPADAQVWGGHVHPLDPERRRR